MGRCRIVPDAGAIALSAPYDAGLVNELKSSIPSTERRWDGDNKRWIVTIRHGPTLQHLCMRYFNEMPLLPDLANAKPKVKQQIIEVRYIGASKDRGGDDRSAFGWMNGGWKVAFPESVLRAWFDAPQSPDEAPTFYSVLSIRRDATEEEIKSGYRRMVMQWHPDRCKEPNAQEQFMAIQHAYEVLTKNREKYDAGLVLEASLRQPVRSFDSSPFYAGGYRSPLRCGLIMCEGVETLGILQVSKIFAWEDVRDNQGRVLVVSWPKGADEFQEVWA